jgi:hypothetical protein
VSVALASCPVIVRLTSSEVSTLAVATAADEPPVYGPSAPGVRNTWLFSDPRF